jgi:hypothetical protein
MRDCEQSLLLTLMPRKSAQSRSAQRLRACAGTAVMTSTRLDAMTRTRSVLKDVPFAHEHVLSLTIVSNSPVNSVARSMSYSVIECMQPGSASIAAMPSGYRRTIAVRCTQTGAGVGSRITVLTGRVSERRAESEMLIPAASAERLLNKSAQKTLTSITVSPFAHHMTTLLAIW